MLCSSPCVADEADNGVFRDEVVGEAIGLHLPERRVIQGTSSIDFCPSINTIFTKCMATNDGSGRVDKGALADGAHEIFVDLIFLFVGETIESWLFGARRGLWRR